MENLKESIVAGSFKLGYEFKSNRQGPALNSHSADYLHVNCLLNCKFDQIYTESKSTYIHKNYENDVHDTYYNYFVSVIDGSKEALFAITGLTQFDFSYDNSHNYKQPEFIYYDPKTKGFSECFRSKAKLIAKRNNINID